MGSRIELHEKLLLVLPNCYFQPPANLKMTYPCIVYSKSGKDVEFGNDGVYLSKQEYQVTVIERDPDSVKADIIQAGFQYCKIGQYFVTDNLYHTTLTLYY